MACSIYQSGDLECWQDKSYIFGSFLKTMVEHSNSEFRIKGEKIVTDFKYFGMTLDPNFNFKKHVNGKKL